MKRAKASVSKKEGKDLWTPSECKVHSTPKEPDYKLFTADGDSVNKKADEQNKEQDFDGKSWGDPAKITIPDEKVKKDFDLDKARMRGASKVNHALSDKLPSNAKDMLVLIRDCNNLLSKSAYPEAKKVSRRCEKILKQFGL